jgi:hypothetical protein
MTGIAFVREAFQAIFQASFAPDLPELGPNRPMLVG